MALASTETETNLVKLLECDVHEIKGFQIYDGFLSSDQQKSLLDEVRLIAQSAPLFTPSLPSGQKMSVRMTCAGKVGWVSDAQGYRYQSHHPNGTSWPDIPQSVLAIWEALLPKNPAPDMCLVNYYDDTASMGLHQDKDEQDMDQPIVSVSLGDDALFRMGNLARGGKTQSIWLRSGDVVVMAGEARRKFHGIDGIKPNSSLLLPKGGRLNVTLRIAT